MRPISVFLILFIWIEVFSQKSSVIQYSRKQEPRENAFSLLVPSGWQIEGGAIRILNPDMGGALNMVECKFDMAVKKDAQGSVMVRWMPEMLCIDGAYAFGNREGAVFNNALVRNKRSPERFITEVGIPYAHPNASNIKIISSKSLPELAQKYQQAVSYEMKMVTNMNYYAGIVEFTYSENGVQYSERMMTVIEDYGMNGGGLWKNRQSTLIRTPINQLKSWESVFSKIQNSGIWSTKWVVGEVNAQRKRGGLVALTNTEIQKLDNEITDSRRKTNAAINHDMYLTVTGNADYINPYTGKTEQDNADFKYRWVDAGGNVIYSDDANYNPNNDSGINVSGYKKSAVKK
jgi:hypothetical protein